MVFHMMVVAAKNTADTHVYHGSGPVSGRLRRRFSSRRRLRNARGGGAVCSKALGRRYVDMDSAVINCIDTGGELLFSLLHVGLHKTIFFCFLVRS